MNEKIEHNEDNPPVGNLTDFVHGVTEDSNLNIEVAIREDGRCAVFYNKPFKRDLSWIEFNLDTFKLDFILDNGEIRNAGIDLTSDMSKYMQNTHQMLMVLMDDDSGTAKEGNYVPIILHKN